MALNSRVTVGYVCNSKCKASASRARVCFTWAQCLLCCFCHHVQVLDPLQPLWGALGAVSLLSTQPPSVTQVPCGSWSSTPPMHTPSARFVPFPLFRALPCALYGCPGWLHKASCVFLKMVLKIEGISHPFPTQNATRPPVYVLYWFVCSFGAVRLQICGADSYLCRTFSPSAHCSAHLKLYINNENVQGLLAQVSRELRFLRLCFRALLCFRELCFVFGSVVQVFYIKLHTRLGAEAPPSSTWRKEHAALCWTSVRTTHRRRNANFLSTPSSSSSAEITEKPAWSMGVNAAVPRARWAARGRCVTDPHNGWAWPVENATGTSSPQIHA